MQLKARAVGLEAEDYLNDKAPEEPDDQSYRRIPVSKYDLQRFASEGEYELSEETADSLVLNEYVLLVTDEGKTMPARLYSECLLLRQARAAGKLKSSWWNSHPAKKPGTAVFSRCFNGRLDFAYHLLWESGYGENTAFYRCRDSSNNDCE